MSWIAFLLGLLLALAGCAGLVASIDLQTTELGLVYAACGAIGVSGGVITIAIGLLIRRVDALRRALLEAREERQEEEAPRAMERAEPEAPPPLAAAEPVVPPDLEAPHTPEAPPAVAVEPAPEAPPLQPQSEVAGVTEGPTEAAPVNENRKGALPGLDALEEAITPAAAKPAGPAPSLIGRYSAGGADYSIFSDGSIEAQTSQGEFKFASMREFKEFISAKKG